MYQLDKIFDTKMDLHEIFGALFSVEFLDTDKTKNTNKNISL